LDTPTLPLMIKVNGPAKDNFVALSYIMETLRGNKQDLLRNIKTMNWNTYMDANVRFDTFDPNEINKIIALKETTHPVRLNFDDIPDRHMLSLTDRSSIVRLVKVLLEENLIDSFELVKVADATIDNNRHLISDSSKNARNPRRLGTVSLPLRITVEGPKEDSDLALAYIMEALEDLKPDLLRGMKNLVDWNTYMNSDVFFDTYEPEDLVVEMEETNHPVRIKFDNVPGYRLSQEEKVSILRSVNELLEDNLDTALELVEVAYAGRNDRRLDFIRRDSISLLLSITVNAPKDLSAFASSNVLEVLKDYTQDIVKKLDSDDQDASVSIEIYDPDEPMVETVHAVRLNLEHVTLGYLSDDLLIPILQFLDELLDADLTEPFDFVNVGYAGNWNGRRLVAPRRLDTDTIPLPLHITVNGREDESKFAQSDIIQVFEDKEREIVEYLKTLGSDFDNVSISTDFYDASDMEETIHPVRLVFENTNPDYIISSNETLSMIQFIEERIDDSLVNALELIDVSYAGRLRYADARMLQDSDEPSQSAPPFPSLPLLIEVLGPADVSDLALVYVIQAIRDNIQKIELYLKALDNDAFKNTRVVVKTFDSSDIIQESDETTPQSSFVKDDWLIWLLVGLVPLLLICCCCICFCCICGHKKHKSSQKSHDSTDKTDLSFSVYDDTVQPSNTEVYALDQDINQYQSAPLQFVPPMPHFTESSSSESSDDDMMCISVNDNGTFADQSALTFFMDPPTENHLKLDNCTYRERKELMCSSVVSGSTRQSALDDGQCSFGSSVLPGGAYNDPNTIHGDIRSQPSGSNKPMAFHASAASKISNELVPFEEEDTQSCSVQEIPEVEMYTFDEDQSYGTYGTQPPVLPSSQSRTSYSVQEDPTGMYTFNEDLSYSTQPPVIPSSQTQVHQDAEGLYYTHDQQPHAVQSQPFADNHAPIGVWEDELPSVATRPLVSDSFATRSPQRGNSVGSFGSAMPRNPRKKYSKRSMPPFQNDAVNCVDDSSDFYLGKTRPSRRKSLKSVKSFTTRGNQKPKYNRMGSTRSRMSSMPPLKLDESSSSRDTSVFYTETIKPSLRNGSSSAGSSTSSRSVKKKLNRNITMPPIQSEELVTPDDSSAFYYGQSTSFYA